MGWPAHRVQFPGLRHQLLIKRARQAGCDRGELISRAYIALCYDKISPSLARETML